MFLYKGVVQPWLCDIMGHMTTRNYLAMFDDATYHFMREMLGWVHSPGATHGWADVKHTIEYKNELIAGDLVEITGRLVRLGERSYTAQYCMVDLIRGKVAAELEVVSVYFDLKQRTSAIIPESIQSKAKAISS